MGEFAPSGDSFTLGAMPKKLGRTGGEGRQPAANATFGELLEACLDLEAAIMPERLPSSTVVINRNAQFRPHTDSGAGAGQSCSLIVGLGDYVGGGLAVEGKMNHIRYQPLEFLDLFFAERFEDLFAKRFGVALRNRFLSDRADLNHSASFQRDVHLPAPTRNQLPGLL